MSENGEIEGEALGERVSKLEETVSKQADEITSLRSNLTDAIKRICTLEAAPPARGMAGLPNRPQPSGPPNHRGASAPTSRGPPSSRQSMGVPSSRRSMASSGPPAKERGQVRQSMGGGRRPPSPAGSASGSTRGRRPSGNGDEVTAVLKDSVQYNLEDGLVRMYIRGRPVTMPLPSDFQLPGSGEGKGPSESPPEQSLALEWVYGYRGRDCRSNLHALPTGELVYFSAAVAVLYNAESQTQRHYVGHTDDIKCIAIHPNKTTIATGQVAGHDRKGKSRKARPGMSALEAGPHVRVWDSTTLNTLKVIGDVFERAVCCLSFSITDGGNLLSAVDEGNEHNLSIWDWQKGEHGTRLVECKSSGDPVLAGEFHPTEEGKLVLCGKSQISFWTFENNSLKKHQGLFGKNDMPKHIICLAFAPSGDVVTGDSNGTVYVWPKDGVKVGGAIKEAHEGPVFSVGFTEGGELVTGGGKDRRIRSWNWETKEPVSEYTVDEALGPVRTITESPNGTLVVGTVYNSVVQGSLDGGFETIVRGHYDELWGLCVHPSQQQFLTSGYDKIVCLWDASTHAIVWSKELPDMIHCASLYPGSEGQAGCVVALGTKPASSSAKSPTPVKWYVLDMATQEIVSTQTSGNEQIECIEYSPDGQLIAVGSRDNAVYVYRVSENGQKYSKAGRCTGHTSFITHLDWSEDSTMLRTNSGDHELLHWSASNCKSVTSYDKVKDVVWATQYCTLTAQSLGIWPDGADGTDINGCCRSTSGALLASADDFGKVNLFSSPAILPKAQSRSYGGHSSHVTATRFLCDDSSLLSTGGKDCAVLQWRVSAASE